jgi:hypothetical protein
MTMPPRWNPQPRAAPCKGRGAGGGPPTWSTPGRVRAGGCGMTSFHRRGLPEIDALIAVHEAEQGSLNETIVVIQAEGTVVTARQTELVSQQQTARRRLSAANGLLTKARRRAARQRSTPRWNATGPRRRRLRPRHRSGPGRDDADQPRPPGQPAPSRS